MEQEEQEQQRAGVVARRGVDERGAALCAPRWPNFLAGGALPADNTRRPTTRESLKSEDLRI